MKTFPKFRLFMVISATAGAAFLPLVSSAFFSDGLRKLHDESRVERDMRREQFRQSILEKRKEILMKLRDRKKELEEKFSREHEGIKADFDAAQGRGETDASSSQATSTHEQEIIPNANFFSTLRKSALDMVRVFSPLKSLLSNAGK